ncbi:hypothetical protein [Streptomyces sp. NPDC051636]|uniref:hypothetical protein n=1 Tax=Streptomyces sp. NPDC051636 TaxID=3365663 RepID=UPI00378C88D9
MPTIRTTMRPDQAIDVDDAEYLDLQRQGLLVEEPTAESESQEPRTDAGTPPTNKKPVAVSGTLRSKES